MAEDTERLKYRNLYEPMVVEGDTHWNYAELADGTRRKMTKEEINNHKLLPPGSTPYQLVSLYPAGLNQTGLFTFRFRGKNYRPPEGNSWFTHEDGMKRLADANRIEPYADGETLRYVLKLSDSPITTLTNLWSDTSAPSDKVYAVQTSTKVLQRCILMTTDPGDLVLDPTCGSGTTARVAEQWGRRWITTDTSRIAVNIAKTRLMTATFRYYQLYDQQNCDLRQGFIYKKVPHITKGSVANNEPLKEETLYDQPLEDKKRLRVAGPFTVETLQSYEPISPEELARQRTEDKELGNFEDLIFAHLKSAGVKTGVKEENAVFVRIDRLAHAALHAEGWFMAAAPAASVPSIPPLVEKKAYLHIGPKFGTVSKQAVTEAIKACRDKRDGDWLLILGFAFESGITELSRSFGSFQVSIVRMHDDLLQQGLLKHDKKGRQLRHHRRAGHPFDR